MNVWPSFPTMHECLNRDFAIRRFCPARLVEQQPHLQHHIDHDQDQILNISNKINDGDHLWFPSHDSSATPCLSPSEEEQFVHGFFNNVDDHHVHNHNESPPVSHHQNQVEALELDIDYFQDHHHNRHQDRDLANFSMVNNDDVYGDVIDPIMIAGEHHDDQLEMSFLFEDVDGGVVSNTVPSAAGTRDAVASIAVTVPEDDESRRDGVVDQGLQLVHLLLACAEAVGCRDTALAHSILSQLWTSASPWGDSLQRVSYCFAAALKSRLSFLLHNVNPNGTFTFTNGIAMEEDVSRVTREEKAEAFELLHQTTPYLAFGFTTANDAICQAAQGNDFLHIIDLGMALHTLLQWPSLIRTLASRPEGPPKLLRITSLVGVKSDLFELEASMKALIDESTSLGVPLEFQTILEPATPSRGGTRRKP